MRYVWRGLAVAGLGIVAIGIIGGVYVARTWDAVWDVPTPDIKASTDPEIVRRGEYLVYGPSHCVVCHASSEGEAVRRLESGEHVPLIGGQRFAAPPLGEVYSKNLTPDPDTGIGRYDDGQIARLLRYSVKPNGRSVVQSLMPFQDLSDDDLTAIVSFLRSRPAVRNDVPPEHYTLIGKIVKSLAPSFKPRRSVNPPASAPPQEPTARRGEYLVRAAGNCGGCHTPYDPMTFAPTGPALSGGNAMAPAQLEGVDRSIWFRPPNLTPSEGSVLNQFPDRATFVARIKRGGRHYPGSPMPWESLSRLTDTDAAAIYEYLHSLAPVPVRTTEVSFVRK